MGPRDLPELDELLPDPGLSDSLCKWHWRSVGLGVLGGEPLLVLRCGSGCGTSEATRCHIGNEAQGENHGMVWILLPA